MHALDTIELDVRRRRRARHERDRTPRPHRTLELSHGLRYESDDLVLPHDADVKVRNERERAAPLPGPAVEDEGACLGDRDSAGGEGAVERVELLQRELLILDELEP